MRQLGDMYAIEMVADVTEEQKKNLQQKLLHTFLDRLGLKDKFRTIKSKSELLNLIQSVNECRSEAFSKHSIIIEDIWCIHFSLFCLLAVFLSLLLCLLPHLSLRPPLPARPRPPPPADGRRPSRVVDPGARRRLAPVLRRDRRRRRLRLDQLGHVRQPLPRRRPHRHS